MIGLQINIGDHSSSISTFIAIPDYHRGMARWARTKANEIARTIPRANSYFRGLPSGRSLTDILGDSSIWVNYAPAILDYGIIDRVGGKEIAISPTAFKVGRWTVLATLIHELAHSNGAPANSKAAEEAVLACGLGKRSEKGASDDPYTPYDPRISG
jgi:hypothetical protein